MAGIGPRPVICNVGVPVGGIGPSAWLWVLVSKILAGVVARKVPRAVAIPARKYPETSATIWVDFGDPL